MGAIKSEVSAAGKTARKACGATGGDERETDRGSKALQAMMQSPRPKLPFTTVSCCPLEPTTTHQNISHQSL